MKVYGKFGYNCLSGKCDFVPTDSQLVPPQSLLYGIAFFFPCCIFITSYYLIWKHARTTALAFSGGSVTRLSKQIKDREAKMTSTILMLSLAFIVFVLPITLASLFDPNVTAPNFYLVAFIIYWNQYSLNFIIYSARSEQYQKAYLGFLKSLKHWICGRSEARRLTSTGAVLIDKALVPNELRRDWPKVIALQSDLGHTNHQLESAKSCSMVTCSRNDHSSVIIVARIGRRYSTASSADFLETMFENPGKRRPCHGHVFESCPPTEPLDLMTNICDTILQTRRNSM